MAQLTFGNIATNMSELQRFGYGSYYSDSSPVVTGLTPTVVTARDPVTGTTLTAVGTFNVFALESSIVTTFSSATSTGQALFSWTNLSATYAQVAPTLSTRGNFQALFTSLLTGADTITGGSAGDTLMGREGNDTINGGGGTDTAGYSGPRSSYTISKVGAGWQVAAKSGTDGTDALSSIEALNFSDMQLSLVAPAAPAGTPAPAFRQSGSFLFDPVFYLLKNPELVPTVALANAAQHYLSTGANAGKAPNAWFDATYYETRWPDLAPLGLDDATLFQHFNLYGVWEGRSPGPKFQNFNGNRYLTDNPDVAAYVDAHVADFLGSRSNGAIAHFIIYGANEQRAAFETSGNPIDLGYLA